jgi:hypothetical protein
MGSVTAIRLRDAAVAPSLLSRLAGTCRTRQSTKEVAMDGSFTGAQSLIARCRVEQDALVEIICVLRNRLRRSGLPDIQLPAQPQRCSLVRDPCDGSTSLVGEWRKHDKTIGSLVIHENGQVFAELDVLLPLQSDERWFVDAVVAFGTTGNLQTELRLTPALT